MDIFEPILIALSLCADCFAVSICSGVTLRSGNATRNTIKVALTFALIQSGLLLAGWMLGNAFLAAVNKISGIIGCILLLYVGGSMIAEALKGECKAHNLDGWKNIVIGGLATSIDALAVGGAESMKSGDKRIFTLCFSVFVITAISVISGLLFGSRLGKDFGKRAEIAGGIVLIVLGLLMLK